MSSSEDIEVELIEAPTLPSTVKGDGRYVMTLLNEYLEALSVQVNLANGFTAEEIAESEDNDYITPKNFYVEFDRTGGTLHWDHISDVSNLAYYETREDTNIGEQIGLLDRTVYNYSTVLPTNYSDTVYLYAVSQDAAVSNVTDLTYTKARPDEPGDIAVTSNDQGSLITFSEIPSDCIGANIYVAGTQYQTTTNLYLYTDSVEIESVEVAYYDQFGEGERGALSLIVPDVTGFLVERNSSELDFYWDSLDVYNVSYVVKVCLEADWAAAEELFRTKTNDKNRYIYPNEGQYYLLVKAYDESGNYSKNAAYQLMNTEAEIDKNIILKFSQNDVGYNGNKINMYYDADLGGVTLEREAYRGEYLMDIQLDQEYKARNWCEYYAFSLSGDDITWDDADFTWDETELLWSGVMGDMDSVEVTKEIAYYKGLDLEVLFSAQLNGDLLTDTEEEPTNASSADEFEQGRWAYGLALTPVTQLEYSLTDMTKEFHMTFALKVDENLTDTILITLSDDDEEIFLCLGYDARLEKFYLRGSDGITVRVKDVSADGRDWLTFGISQGETERSLYVYSFNNGTNSSGTKEAEPLGNFTKLFCYCYYL